ncbi:MAG: FAD-dependent oxidoreductase [Crenarchaeota archaeon]|nr:FAD-dependent oxidoreductase [Thermoproteota archaeon]
MRHYYDVVIVGAGPAGLFAAFELVKNSKNKLKVAIIEQGGFIDERLRNSDYVKGWGGAGLFADGKITVSTQVGGWLSEIIGERKTHQLIEYVDKIWSELCPESKVIEPDRDAVEDLISRARTYHMHLIPYRVRHVGSDNTIRVLRRIHDLLNSHVDIYLKTTVKNILINNMGRVAVTENNDEFVARYLVLAPGRTGSNWLKDELEKLGAKMSINPVDIGVRVEATYETLKDITDILYDPKFIYAAPTYDERVRTFCVNPRGYVIKEQYEDVITTNGHSYTNKKSLNTNFAVLVSSFFTEPFKDPIAYGKHIARLANLLAGGSVLIQRLGDLRRGRRSTKDRIARSIVEPTLEDAVPGDISFALPHRHLVSILEFLQTLDKIAPGVYSDDTLLYAVEAKFYSSRVSVNEDLEVEGIKNVFVCGDGAGITRGLAQSSASGVAVARAILRRENLWSG